jgi:hypothetical protein
MSDVMIYAHRHADLSLGTGDRSKGTYKDTYLAIRWAQRVISLKCTWIAAYDDDDARGGADIVRCSKPISQRVVECKSPRNQPCFITHTCHGI